MIISNITLSMIKFFCSFHQLTHFRGTLFFFILNINSNLKVYPSQFIQKTSMQPQMHQEIFHMIEDKKTSIGTNIQVSETLFGRIETDFDYEGQGQRIKSIQSFVGRFKKKENSQNYEALTIRKYKLSYEFKDKKERWHTLLRKQIKCLPEKVIFEELTIFGQVKEGEIFLSYKEKLVKNFVEKKQYLQDLEKRQFPKILKQDERDFANEFL